MPKLKVLSSYQVRFFETPPILTSDEKEMYFDLSVTIKDKVNKLRSPLNKVLFILTTGYFKCTGRFFPIDNYHTNDIEYVFSKLNIDKLNFDNYINKRTQYRHRETILKMLGVKSFKKDKSIDTLINNLVKENLNPKTVFYKLCDYLRSNRIEIPSYSVLQKLIAVAVLKYENNILNRLERYLNKKNIDAMDMLLERDDKYKEESNVLQKRYKITSLKKPKQSIKYSVVRKTVSECKLLKYIFNELYVLIKNMNLPKNVIEYYSTITVKSDVHQLHLKDRNKKYLYLLCFVINQYLLYQDTLIDIFIKSVQKTINHTSKEQVEKSFEKTKNDYQKIDNLINLAESSEIQLEEVKNIINTDEKSDSEKVNKIKTLLEEAEEKKIQFQKQISEMREQSKLIRKDKIFYDILEKKSISLQRKLNRMIPVIDFDKNNSEKKIINAIEYFKQREKNLSKDAPINFLEKYERGLVFDDDTGKLKRPLYKALLFIETAKGLKSGSINLNNSNKYQSLDDYLISKEEWEDCKHKLLKEAGLEGFIDIKSILKKLEKELENQYRICNRNIIKERNPHARIVNGKLKVNTPKVIKSNTVAMKELFPKQEYTSLLEILFSVNGFTRFLDSINHYQYKYTKKRPNQRTFFAGIMAYGCNIGASKMSKISKNINKKELMNVLNWYLTPENIENACNKILNRMSELDLLNLFKKDTDKNHTSSDAQKYVVSKESLNANYSYKYFGHKPGLSINSFIDEAHRLFYSTVISSSEREAAYVIDGLMNNDVVKSDIHSTDTHGYSEIIFSITHMLGISFAPRIKNFKDQYIYSLKPRKHYIEKDYPVLPKERIRTETIINEWDDVLRLIATIKLKRCSASQIFKRLSSYSKQHPLYRAIKSFGRIIKSIFILKYIDNVELRQDIEKQLNKIESLHRLAKVVFFGNNQEFNYSTKEEQEIVESCKRLIELSIICWNYMYLSQLLSDMPYYEKERTINIIKNGSILVWHHLNVLGEYDFAEEKIKDNIGFDFSKIVKLKVA